MATDIKVNVITLGGETHEVEVPPDIRAEDFIKELISVLKLPVTDAEGHAISWRIDNKDTGHTLEGGRTMDENGVKDSHRLMLIRATTAGCWN
jgi:uncharacterized ubiquitin-like protein YukD